MKKSIFVILSAILIFASCSEDKKTHLKEFGFNGKVESVRYATYKAVEKFGEITKGRITLNFITMYRGYSLPELPFCEITLTSLDGHYLSEYYNEKGFLIKQYTTYIDYDDNEINANKIYKYDNKNKLIECCSYNSEGDLYGKMICKYDNKNNPVECCFYDSDGDLDEKVIYKYDNKNNPVECCLYDSDGDLEEKYLREYDKKNNITEEYYYKSTDDLEYNYSYKYDNKNNIIEFSNHDNSDDLDYKCCYKYDKKNQHIKTSQYDSSGNFKGEYIAKYNKNNNIIEEIFQGDHNSNITYTYEYDDKKNWIKKVTYEKNRPVSIEEREITYY